MSEPRGALFEMEVSSADDDVKVVVDLSELTFIDSSGISVLVTAARAASAERGTLVVAAPSPHVRRVFDIVKLSELMAIEDGLDGALKRLGWGREQPAG
jgi:anti-sigma B factor antagonist